MTHLAFTTRPDYRKQRNQPLEVLREHAATALKAGHLNLTTLWFFRICWLRGQTHADFLSYLLCRRQFGYPLTASHQARVQKLLTRPVCWLYIKGLRRHSQNQLKCLLNEAEQGNKPAGPQHKIAGYWLSQQSAWQQQWLDRLRDAKYVHVVGNSPHLSAQQQGEEIDSADIVIRFNHFQSQHTSATDIGHKLSAWVAAPGYLGPVPPSINVSNPARDSNATHQAPTPLIIAGPAMLNLQQNFDCLTGGNSEQVQVLQVPLSIWRQQVRRFAAPPSAGALLLAWLLDLKSEHQLTFTLKGYGFGYDQQAQTRYHIAKPDHRPVARHHWHAEHQWMKSILSK